MSDQSPAATVHIAGVDVTIGDRYLRQRCAWCGVTLIDYDLTRIAVPEGQDPRPSTWLVGALVETDGTVSRTVDVERLPDNACALIHPELLTL